VTLVCDAGHDKRLHTSTARDAPFFPKLHSGASYVSFTVVDMAKCVVIDIFPNRQPERVLQ
jgi:hypothetical protein